MYAVQHTLHAMRYTLYAVRYTIHAIRYTPGITGYNPQLKKGVKKGASGKRDFSGVSQTPRNSGVPQPPETYGIAGASRRVHAIRSPDLRFSGILEETPDKDPRLKKGGFKKGGLNQ